MRASKAMAHSKSAFRKKAANACNKSSRTRKGQRSKAEEAPATAEGEEKGPIVEKEKPTKKAAATEKTEAANS
ncbi:MAG: hypothetical protein R2877_00300 [Bdellovibrionota bacterium]